MRFNGKRILVTGGTGFIGAHLISALVLEGAEVHTVVQKNLDTGWINKIKNPIYTHTVSLEDTGNVEAVLKKVAPQGIFHLAGVSQNFHFRPTLEELVGINVSASLHFMKVASSLPLEFFVNTGTFTEYGSKNGAVNEEMMLEPNDLYSISRIPADLYAQSLGRKSNLPFSSIRVFTPYGPMVQKGKLIYELITNALLEKPLVLTHPSVTRDFIYIDDLIQLYLAAAVRAKDVPGESFNGGSGTSTTLEELSALVLKCVGKDIEIVWKGSDVSYDSAHWQADVAKASRLLSWAPQVRIQDGLEETIRWFNSNRSYWKS